MGDFKTKYEMSLEKRENYVESFRAPDANILVVDDNRTNLLVVELLLKDTQVNITLAESGAQAISLVGEKDFDLILLDHMMPQMDGIETLQEIRKKYPEKIIPIVALTANAISGVMKKCSMRC